MACHVETPGAGLLWIGWMPADRGPDAVATRRPRRRMLRAGRATLPLVVAHRGAWRPAPQNSLEAFEEAVQLGCDAIELDVRRTLDGRVVVVHDARVGVRSIAKLTHEEIQSRPRHRHAPALEEVLELVAGRIGVDLELKEDGYVEQAMAIVKRRLPPEQYVVTSFHDSVLPTVKRTAPAVRTGLLLSPNRQIGQLPHRVAATKVDFLAPTRGSPAPACSPGRRPASSHPGCGRSTTAGRCACSAGIRASPR